ncbi:MAG: serine acetyltransferase [Acidobacteriota bacterium]|nr:serine acetyltransferase [Acidobacteriota bacterium]
MSDVREKLITKVADRLAGKDRKLAFFPGMTKDCRTGLPSRDVCLDVMRQLRSILFPGYFQLAEFSGEGMVFHIGAILDRVAFALQDQIHRGYCFACGGEDGATGDGDKQCESHAGELTDAFLGKIPEIAALLEADVQAAYDGDPALQSPSEAIFCCPGIFAITNHRVAHEFYKLGVPIIPRIISENAHSVTGIDIHPGARIGKSFFIDHGTGVVIGETSVIGDGVRIYQGVTLGAKSFPLDGNGVPIKGIDRHPIIGDGVVIYAGATILGRVTVGSGSVIGGNVWLTRSVPPGSFISQGREPNGKDVFQTPGEQSFI